jgi:hypothetical protein
MKSSPHMTVQSFWKLLDFFYRSRISSLHPPSPCSVITTNSIMFSSYNWIFFYIIIFKGEDYFFTKHIRIQSWSYNKNKNKRYFSINLFTPYSLRIRNILSSLICLFEIRALIYLLFPLFFNSLISFFKSYGFDPVKSYLFFYGAKGTK